jgi:MFS family permease
LWSAATAAAAFAHSFWTFLIARAAVGVGEAAYATLSPSILSDYYPAEKRNRVLTIFYMAIPVGAALGYEAGGYLGQKYGWRAAFLACGLPGIATAALVLMMREPRRGQFDVAPPKDAITWGQALRFLRSRKDFVVAVAGYTAVTFASGALADWFPSFLQRYRGFSVADASIITGITAAVGGLIGTVLGGAGGDWLKGRTRQAYLALSAWTMAVATVLALLALLMPSRPAIWACMFGAQIMLWCYNSPINTIIVNAVPAHLRPYAVSVSIFSIHAFGDAASPSIVGKVADLTGTGPDHTNLQFAISFVPIAMAVGTLIWLVGWRRLPETTEAAA